MDKVLRVQKFCKELCRPEAVMFFPSMSQTRKKKFVSLYITVQTQTRFLTLTLSSLCSHFKLLEITPLVLNHSDDDDIGDNSLPKATQSASDLGRICPRSAWWQNLSSCYCITLLFDKAVDTVIANYSFFWKKN